MAGLEVTTSLSTEDDVPTLASIMTTAFAAVDAAYPLVWSSDAIHAAVAIKGLFTPLQREGRLTFKAMDGVKIVGFATWNLPKPNTPKKALNLGKGENKKPQSVPEIPGVNTKFLDEKMNAFKEASERDVEPSEDITLSLFFVHPDYQRRGIGTLLLQWGLKKADELQARIWLSSTPQAVATYEKNGWKVVQRYDIDLGTYEGSGIYSRAWMVRQPREIV